jgi:N-acetylmuramic acid 6-phosphate etherase
MVPSGPTLDKWYFFGIILRELEDGMSATQTEMIHPSASGLDTLPPQDVLAILCAGQVDAAKAVATAIPAIAEAAELAARTLSDGGRLIYAAAGSSGLMALADALELPGTYGIDPGRIVVLLAGGLDALTLLAGAPEDDTAAAERDLARVGIGAGDCLIAVTASGSTPYPMTTARLARAAGARTIGIANNRGAALFETVDVGVCLPTPPEVIAGSTRMGAGTAQKIALNMLSTMMAVHLGHVHDGFMVNLIADNAKLRGRARRIVTAVGDIPEEQAGRRLDEAKGSVKAAILLAAGAENLDAAERLLAGNGQRLRSALAALKG